jgi:hypothetical protein
VSLVLFSFAAFAETESVVEPLGGVIVEIGEEGLLLDQGDGNYVVVHMEESTPITGVEELEVGMYVFVRYNGVMTRSLPPQVTAEEIQVNRLSGPVVELYDDGFLMTDETVDDVIVHWEDPASTVAVGGNAVVYTNGVMALSMPGQVTGLKVDFFALEGTVYAQTETGFVLAAEDGALYEILVGEDTRVDAEIAQGALVKVLYDGALTRSIPAQANALAVVALRNKEIERIVLTRPAVEAGEKLGFLPGDLSQKVDPYLRPLYDALYDMMGAESYQRLQERGVLEVAPLAYMRGRTLSDSFIILDEAQNTTPEQMKMFLTRFGAGSRVVVTGDVTQTDLPPGKQSGLTQALEVLRGIPEIAIVTLDRSDVVRHDLVQTVVRAYETYESTRKGGGHDAG